jgi:hypothetical protein
VSREIFKRIFKLDRIYRIDRIILARPEAGPKASSPPEADEKILLIL